MYDTCPRYKLSKFRSVLFYGTVFIAMAALLPAGFAQQIRPDAIPVKNWPLSRSGDRVLSGPSAEPVGATSGLVFIAMTPCRVMDTRGQGGSDKTGAFGPPSLLAGQARVVPVPSSNCGVPAAAEKAGVIVRERICGVS